MPRGKGTKQPIKTGEIVLIVVALIGLSGTIIAAFISNIDKWWPNRNINSPNVNLLTPTPTPTVTTPTPTAGRLAGEIKGVEVIPNPGGGVQVFIRLSVTNNTGEPTAVPKYSVRIDHVTSKSFQYNGPTHEIENSYTLPEAGVVKAQDSMITKTRQAIPKDREVVGWLRVLLPNPFLEPHVVRQEGTRYYVSFADAAGKTYEVSYEVR